VYHGRKDGCGLYHIFNTSHKKVSAAITLNDERNTFLADARTGEFRALDVNRGDGAASFTYDFAESEAIAVIAAKKRPRSLKAKPCLTKRRPIEGWQARPLGDNALVLADWVGRIEGQKYRKLPKLVQAREVFGLSPEFQFGGIRPEFRQPDWSMGPRVLTYRSSFAIRERPRSLRLVTDRGSILGDWQVLVNGRKATFRRGKRRWAIENIEADILKLVRKGKNEVLVRVEIQDMRHGMLDFLRLYGDFELDEKLRIGTRKKTQAAGDWTKTGFPHYTGTFEYASDIKWEGGPAEIQFERVRDLVEVLINGKSAGVVAWAPWRLDVSDHLKRGKNAIRLRVVNTQINEMEGTPRPSGLTGRVWLRY
jgi:hypothetical protein